MFPGYQRRSRAPRGLPKAWRAGVDGTLGVVEVPSSYLAVKQDPAPAKNSPNLQLTLVLPELVTAAHKNRTAFSDSRDRWSRSPLSKAELV